MQLRTCSALLLFLLSACATMDPSPGEVEAPSPRLANLQRAALYPWTDDGQCVVREASNEWPILAERCFHALDRDRVRFRDVNKKCAVAYVDAAAPAAPAVVALCIFAAPEIVVGAVIVVGTVVVAAAIQEGIDAYQRHAARERAKQLRKERAIAVACGYDFVVGVSTQAHKAALLQEDPFLKIVITGCTR